MRLLPTLLLISPFLAASLASASGPSDALLGDWDMGTNADALRITVRDQQSIFVQFCKRPDLVSTGLCNANIIVYFNYSPANQDFTHTETAELHLNATLRIDPNDSSKIDYTFTNDTGSGTVVGTRFHR